ncbi:hypothetical protein AVEN_33569-1 [Araneus ventricosus]|uniref:Uncharacterized protein n=1 Tax=Araneus ventricosus TaxID=182803 RepID=A0A4Y2Q9T7_ARAVE|nr:hypothetical protein AVEN_33569-1 [Araneus ventricosus]
MCRLYPSRKGQWWPSGKASASELEGPKFETRFYSRSTVYVGLLLIKYDVVDKFPLAGGCGDLVVRSRLRKRRAPGSKPDSTEDPPCFQAKYDFGQTSFRECGAEVWRGSASSGVVLVIRPRSQHYLNND